MEYYYFIYYTTLFKRKDVNIFHINELFQEKNIYHFYTYLVFII